MNCVSNSYGELCLHGCPFGFRLGACQDGINKCHTNYPVVDRRIVSGLVFPLAFFCTHVLDRISVDISKRFDQSIRVSEKRESYNRQPIFLLMDFR